MQEVRSDGDDGVFLDKRIGVISEKCPGVSKDNIMAYLSKSQEHMISTYGSDIICMDGTHGTNAYGIEETYKILFRKLK